MNISNDKTLKSFFFEESTNFSKKNKKKKQALRKTFIFLTKIIMKKAGAHFRNKNLFFKTESQRNEEKKGRTRKGGLKEKL